MAVFILVCEVDAALARLESAIELANAGTLQSASARESLQAELTAGWESHTNRLEAELADAQAETQFLKDENARLSNQLQQLQQEHLELQTTASKTLSRIDRSVKQLDLLMEPA
jgi:predicted  nucleic acid-binding Zn-ribbon protein